MRWLRYLFCAVFLLLVGSLVGATIFGGILGIVHDPQHRPIAGADVKVKSATSDWFQATQTDAEGKFTFSEVPVGEYVVTVSRKGFSDGQKSLTVASSTSPVLHFQLALAPVTQTTVVSADADEAIASPDTATPETLVSRRDIQLTPGTDRTNSLQMITNFVPGAYTVHDQLHVRGGHQVSWMVDGVPIPNTNIASNVGPQFDPKDIDYLEIQRGSYSAEYGDRTYGVFNVVPRSGFERNNEGELVSSLGNFYQTNDQVNFGSHTNRFAYFTSLNFNRSNYGLQTPVGDVLRDAENGFGGYASLLFNRDAKNQFRLVTSLRRDYYQIPNNFEQQSVCPQTVVAGSTCSIHDGQHEADAFVNFSWVRTINPNIYVTVSPFYHFNSANLDGGLKDFPISTTDHHNSAYAGLHSTFNTKFAKNDFQAGIYGFGQHDHQFLRVLFNDQSSMNFSDRELRTGGIVEGFFDDKFKPTSWLTLMAGVRLTHFNGDIQENAAGPRFGVAVQLPRVHWVFRAFYGHYYQPPPLITASGPLLQFVTSQNLNFVPLHGERDEEHQFGVTVPVHGWVFDADTFQTRARNFFDHNNIGESNLFFPVTFDGALIRGWELTIRSPRLWNRGQVHLAYSNQVAKARGSITGGLVCTIPADCSLGPNYVPLDHDQRNTLNAGFDVSLPWRTYASSNVYYGSGFTNGAFKPPAVPNAYLPGHTTFDATVGKSFGENYSIAITALNVANRHLLIDNSQTFGGFHYNDPREIYVEFRWRFHY